LIVANKNKEKKTLTLLLGRSSSSILTLSVVGCELSSVNWPFGSTISHNLYLALLTRSVMLGMSLSFRHWQFGSITGHELGFVNWPFGSAISHNP
jgi:hypothetical protein